MEIQLRSSVFNFQQGSAASIVFKSFSVHFFGNLFFKKKNSLCEQTMAVAGDLLRLSVFNLPKLSFGNGAKLKADRFSLLKRCPRGRFRCRPRSTPGFVLFSSLETRLESEESIIQPVGQKLKDSSVLLDVNGMMCGGCVSRVKSVISSDERVESVVVNLLTETAAIKLKREVMERETAESVAESIAQRVSECGFMAKRRVSGIGIAENVRKWKEMLKKKEELLVKSRNRVAFAWTLVALCCGAHASHILHALGIHFGHGNLNQINFLFQFEM